MLLGKRARPPIKRTTSMTEFTLDLNHTATVVPGCNTINNSHDPNVNPPPDDHRVLISRRRNSADHIETPPFMTVCSLCNRRLIPGRDIFMYRGDRAFCSSECRQEQMDQDEKKDKHSLIPKKPVSEFSSNASKID